MKINIDFSIFSSPNEPFGNVTGIIDIPSLPAVGDTIFFMFSQVQGISMPQVGFSGMLKVNQRSFRLGLDIILAIDLGEIVVSSVEDAKNLLNYFEKGFGLIGCEY